MVYIKFGYQVGETRRKKKRTHILKRSSVGWVCKKTKQKTHTHTKRKYPEQICQQCGGGRSGGSTGVCACKRKNIVHPPSFYTHTHTHIHHITLLLLYVYCMYMRVWIYIGTTRATSSLGDDRAAYRVESRTTTTIHIYYYIILLYTCPCL